MSVLKMKKLRLLVLRSRRDELLRELIRRGCVEFSCIDGRIKGSQMEGLLCPESSALPELEQKLRSLERAIELLEKYTPAIKRMQRKKPELEDSVLLDDTGLNFALRKAESVLELSGRISYLEAEQKRLEGLAKELQPWVPLDVPLNIPAAENCSLLVGGIPSRTDYEKLSAELEQIDERSELFLIKEDKNCRYIALLCMREQLEKMEACLGARGFHRAPVPDTGGTAMQCVSDARERIQKYAQEEKHCRELIAEEIIHRDTLKLAADRVSVKIALAGAEERFYGTESALLMEGWLPEEREEELAELFERLGCAYEISRPEAEEYPEVPVRLDNGKRVRLGLGKGPSFRPLEIKPKYFKLAE